MSADRPLSPEAQRLLDARNEAVAELKGIDGVDRDIRDPNVVRLATARIFEQSVTMRMLAGENVASSELQNATRMVADARDALPQPQIEVQLTIVRKTRDELVGPYAPIRTEPPVPSTPKLLPPPVIDGEVVEQASKATPDAQTKRSTSA